MVSFRFDDKNEAVKYDLTNACHGHNVHMRVVAGIYVTRPVPHNLVLGTCVYGCLSKITDTTERGTHVRRCTCIL